MAMLNVYPHDEVEVLGFTYCSDLHLTRSIEAVKTRRGEDAKYLVGSLYRASVEVRSGDGNCRSHHICVPRGYMTDLASVPNWARLFIGRAGPHLEACIVHDWLYEAWIVTEEEPRKSMKHFADEVLKAALKEAGIAKHTTWTIHKACSKFGGKEFRRRGSSDDRPSKSDVIDLCDGEDESWYR